jgi:hypothetical protein
VVRFNFVLSAAIGFVTALMLTTCASPSRVVWGNTINVVGKTHHSLQWRNVGDGSVWRSVSLTILVRLKVIPSALRNPPVRSRGN